MAGSTRGSRHKRFMRKVHRIPGGCWIWTAADNGRYGNFFWSPDERHVHAHQAAYRLFVGAIPDGQCVCHTCDTPLCVNPAHLWLGTHGENMADAKRKGRIAAGEEAGPAKLTWEDVREIRRRFPETEEAIQATAGEFGVARRTVYRILRGETWREDSPALRRYRQTRRNPNKGPRATELTTGRP